MHELMAVTLGFWAMTTGLFTYPASCIASQIKIVCVNYHQSCQFLIKCNENLLDIYHSSYGNIQRVSTDEGIVVDEFVQLLGTECKAADDFSLLDDFLRVGYGSTFDQWNYPVTEHFRMNTKMFVVTKL